MQFVTARRADFWAIHGSTHLWNKEVVLSALWQHLGKAFHFYTLEVHIYGEQEVK